MAQQSRSSRPTSSDTAEAAHDPATAAEPTEPRRWVVVPKVGRSKTILGGPYLWDGVTEWEPPEGEDGKLMLESEAFEVGYQHPDSGAQ